MKTETLATDLGKMASNTTMNNESGYLVEKFANAASAHHSATIAGNYKLANKEADKVHRAFTNITSVGLEARMALLVLAETGNDEVACMAATYSLKFAPERSLVVLHRLSAGKSIVAFQAEQAMKRWASGEWMLE